jgi:PTH2 family peptidyl-tRNA hydrolase
MKLAVVVRKDLDMRCGKIAVQVGHASVMAYEQSSTIICSNTRRPVNKEWADGGQKKIVLKVKDGLHLVDIENLAILNGVVVVRVYDFGLTQIAPNTWTCIAIGPDEDEKIDAITKGLSLL